MKPQDYGKWTMYWDDRRYEIERWRHTPRQPGQFPHVWISGHVMMPPGYSRDWYQHGKAIVGPERIHLEKEYMDQGLKNVIESLLEGCE